MGKSISSQNAGNKSLYGVCPPLDIYIKNPIPKPQNISEVGPKRLYERTSMIPT